METFDGYDFDSMTDTTALHAPAAVDRGEDERFMRGLMFGLLFTLPCWLVIIGAAAAVMG